MKVPIGSSESSIRPMGPTLKLRIAWMTKARDDGDSITLRQIDAL
jgi:hypothetical protein